MSEETKPFLVTLKNRGLIHVKGRDSAVFLQNIITNDIRLLESQSSLYACFLTPKGLFLHDFFVVKTEEEYFLDCEGGERALDLARRLILYKLRSDITITCEPEIDVRAVLLSSFPENVKNIYLDPRHESMGWRSLQKPDGLEERGFEVWDRLRLSLGIPDGSRDMIPEQSNMIESRIDIFNGVSFTKGCYLGQELTARLHLRGVCKRHLYPVEIKSSYLESGTEIHINGKHAGEMRSSCGDIGLALLQDSAVEKGPSGKVRL